jgi:hypothetical protein
MFDIFQQLDDYNKYFENQLTLSGTILGLLVATSTFILQSGFSNFQYSRSMFLKYYVEQSKFIFLCLAYNIIFSLIILYINTNAQVLFFLHLIFGIVFTKYFLDFQSHKGYILTINSNKFNPYKWRLFKYFRYINNLGLLPVLITYTTIYFIFFYPLHFNNAFNLDKHQVFMTTVSCFGISIIILINIIPQFFTFSEQEYKSKTKNELRDDLESDVSKENEILRETLIKNGRKEFTQTLENKYFDSIDIYMPQNSKEAFFVINVEFKNRDIYEMAASLKKYSFEIFDELASTHFDVNSFVLSYFIKVDDEQKSRNYFLRTNRNEIKELKAKYFSPEEFIENINNRVLDELFRNI